MGTYNGNPLVAHVGLVLLREVLTPAAYAHFDRARRPARRRLPGGRSTSTGLPAHTVDLGAKGCVSYRPTPLTNYRDFLETQPELFAAVVIPGCSTAGIFMTPGDEEQWTLSVQHTDADIDQYIEVFGGFCDALVD